MEYVIALMPNTNIAPRTARVIAAEARARFTPILLCVTPKTMAARIKAERAKTNVEAIRVLLQRVELLMNRDAPLKKPQEPPGCLVGGAQEISNSSVHRVRGVPGGDMGGTGKHDVPGTGHLVGEALDELRPDLVELSHGE